VGKHGLAASIERTLSVRDKLHQDKIGARADIDWHAFSYDAAFVPASHAIRTLLRREASAVPATSRQPLQRFDDSGPKHFGSVLIRTEQFRIDPDNHTKNCPNCDKRIGRSDDMKSSQPDFSANSHTEDGMS